MSVVSEQLEALVPEGRERSPSQLGPVCWGALLVAVAVAGLETVQGQVRVKRPPARLAEERGLELAIVGVMPTVPVGCRCEMIPTAVLTAGSVEVLAAAR